MPSIFIWKSETPNTSKKYIKQYIGIDWILEDTINSSRSYIIHDQHIYNIKSTNILIYDIDIKSSDWTGGSEILRVVEVPYQFISVNEYGTLEKIGNWMRFITHKDITHCNEIYDKMYEILSKMSITTNLEYNIVTHSNKIHTNINTTVNTNINNRNKNNYRDNYNKNNRYHTILRN
jgi:hypothetical protein